MRSTPLQGVGLVLVAAFVSGSNGFRPEAARAPAPVRHTVEIRKFTFVTDSLTVLVGDTVEWINYDVVPHTASAVDSSWTSGSIGTGERWFMVVTEEAGQEYLCRYHPTMRGRIGWEYGAMEVGGRYGGQADRQTGGRAVWD